MISRTEIADAYQCCIDYARMKIRAAGINHQKRLSLEEFGMVVKKNGMPTNLKYYQLAEYAIKSPIQFELFPEVKNHLHIFPGVKNNHC